VGDDSLATADGASNRKNASAGASNARPSRADLALL
jgi:hypothetical protein